MVDLGMWLSYCSGLIWCYYDADILPTPLVVALVKLNQLSAVGLTPHSKFSDECSGGNPPHSNWFKTSYA